MGRRPRSGHGRRARPPGNSRSAGPNTPRVQPRSEETSIRDSVTVSQPFIRRNSTETSLVNALSRLHLSDDSRQSPLHLNTSNEHLLRTASRIQEGNLSTDPGISTTSKQKTDQDGKNQKKDDSETRDSNPTPPLHKVDCCGNMELLKLDNQEREPGPSTPAVAQIPPRSPLGYPSPGVVGVSRFLGLGQAPLLQGASRLLSLETHGHVAKRSPVLQFSLVPHEEVWGDSATAGDVGHHPLLRSGFGDLSSSDLGMRLPQFHAENEFARYLHLLSAGSSHNERKSRGVTENAGLALRRSPAATPRSTLLPRSTLRCSPRNTLLIFDWDDTLFPSSWLRCAGIDPLNQVQFGSFSDLPLHVQEALSACEDMVLQVLEAAHELGMVMVVSNAHTRWLRLSLDKLMPRVGALMRQKEVAVMSARCVCEAVGCADAAIWKSATFDALIDAFMRTHAAQIARQNPFQPQHSPMFPNGGTLRNLLEQGTPRTRYAFPDSRIPRALGVSGTAAVMMAMEDRDAGDAAVETDKLPGGSTTFSTKGSRRHITIPVQLCSGERAKQNRAASGGGEASRAVAYRCYRPKVRFIRPQSGVRFSTTPSFGPQRSSDSCCSGCSEKNSEHEEDIDGQRCCVGACLSSVEEENDVELVNHSPQHSNFYNILAFGDQAHDRFAFFTAAENVIRRHQTEACRQMQQQQPSEQLPCFLEPEEIFTPACAAFSPAEVSSLTGRCSAAVANSQVRGFPVNSQHFQGGSPVSNASDMLESRFEVVVDFDSERLQQQVRQLQVLQQRQFPLPLRQQLQPLLPFAEQSSAVSERLLWHFRCPESPLQPHAPETLLLRRLSRSSSDSKSDAVEVERKSDGRDVDSQQAEQQCESPAEPGDTTAHNDTGHSLERRQNVANRSRRRRLRRPGSHNRPGDSNFHYRNPADLRHCMKPSNTVKTRTQSQKMEQGQQTDARQGGCVEAPAEHDNYGNSADSKSVYLKSVRLIAGPSAAELSQQLAVLATSLRRLAESPSFHDLQVQSDSFSQKAVLLPGLLTSQTESTAAASVATAASAMATAAVTAARAAATAAAAVRRVATPVADLSAPVEAVLAASAMAAQAAATAAASAADAFAVTAATGVEAGVETELTPLPPEADFIPLSPEVKEQVRQPEQLTRINHLAKHFAEWRRVATEGREAAKRESEAGSTNTADTMNVAQNAGERVLRVAQQRGNRMEDAARIPVGEPFTLRTSTEELDEFGIMEEKLLRRRNIRRGASRK